MIRVGLLGSRGKTGRLICSAVALSPDLELVSQLGSGDSPEVFVETSTQVVVDFTHPDAVMANLKFLVEHGIHAVVGTTGFDDGRLREVRGWLAEKPPVGVLIAPNFAIGAVLAKC